jgi:hypothetical protein
MTTGLIRDDIANSSVQRCCDRGDDRHDRVVSGGNLTQTWKRGVYGGTTDSNRRVNPLAYRKARLSS